MGNEPGPARDAADVLARCEAMGFARAGIADAEPTAYESALRAWLASGQHGEMAYLERNADVLADPTRLVDGARSVICVLDRYHHGQRDRPVEPTFGRIGRYARGRDYHKVLKRRLHELADALREAHPDHVFRACVDTAPILEREYAHRAGLGAIGKHTLLMEPGIGSWSFIGEIVTTAALEPSAPGPDDACGSCTRCIDACPTDAITPFQVDARRCISYLTIEHRGPIARDLESSLSGWLFGCDICQEVCPHARPTRRSRRLPLNEAYAEQRKGFDLLEVLGWNEDDRRTALAGTALRRARLDMFKRNAILLLAPQVASDADVRAAVVRIAEDAGEPEALRALATRALAGDVGPSPDQKA